MRLLGSMMIVSSWLEELLNVFFPLLCVGCDEVLVEGDLELCTNCLGELPEGESFSKGLYGIEAKFWGYVPIGYGGALFDLGKAHSGRKIIHAIKYGGRSDVAEFLGRYYGKSLEHTKEKWGWELILPIPLHKERTIERGYNQSFHWAKGIGEALKIAVADDWLIRERYTDSQTGKSKEERFESVNEVFTLSEKSSVAGKSLLLVDDVITTGATLVNAARPLLEGGAQSVSVVALGSRVEV